MCVPFVVVDDRPIDVQDIAAIDPGQVAAVAIFRIGTTAPAHVANVPTFAIDEFGRRANKDARHREPTDPSLEVQQGFVYGPACGVLMIYTARGADLLPPRW